MESLEQLLGTDLNVTMRTLIAFAIVLILILVVAWVFRRLSYGSVRRPRRGRVARLAVLEAIAVDQRRRLVLLRRDNTEHLVMIGGSGDLVIEQGIQRVSRPHAARTEPPMRQAPQSPAPMPRNGDAAAPSQPAAGQPTPPPPAQPARPAAPAASAEPKSAELAPQARPSTAPPLAARTAPRPAPQPAPPGAPQSVPQSSPQPAGQTPPRPTPPAPPPSAPPPAGEQAAVRPAAPQAMPGAIRPAPAAPGQPSAGQPPRPGSGAPAKETEGGEMSDSERQLADMANRLKDALNIPAKNENGDSGKAGDDQAPSAPRRNPE